MAKTTKRPTRNPETGKPRLPEDTSHLGGSATMGRRGQTVYAGPIVNTLGGHAVLKGSDHSLRAIPAQIEALNKAINRNLHRIAGMVRADKMEQAAKLTRLTGRMVGTCQALADELAKLPHDQAPADAEAALRWHAEREARQSVRPSRSIPKGRKLHGSKPGFGSSGPSRDAHGNWNVNRPGKEWKD